MGSSNLISKRDITKAQRDDIKGQAAELIRNFAHLSGVLDTLLKKGINDACILIENTAAVLAPVDTGLLRKSITHRVTEIPNGVLGQVGTANEYAVYQEFGTGIYAKDGTGRKTPWVYTNDKGEKVWTRGNHPKPFMNPALERHRTGIKTVIARRLREVET